MATRVRTICGFVHVGEEARGGRIMQDCVMTLWGPMIIGAGGGQKRVASAWSRFRKQSKYGFLTIWGHFTTKRAPHYIKSVAKRRAARRKYARHMSPGVGKSRRYTCTVCQESYRIPMDPGKPCRPCQELGFGMLVPVCQAPDLLRNPGWTSVFQDGVADNITRAYDEDY